ncbi:hypothetical protein K493DRAFT_309030 [Basidiobolus meristosporus CBS 931.73]|uniref:Uncharacterized protein n=1 Tax=Basidiobolus meristosporus CBS 931.73 TaxID=1314790 RepID=A0A1Y1WTG2_9FUNG|nr:hypothetical protein K493DRAFT_309030 [Basidiobolus meristosporus CBS 931.73]|eukprot:ORX76434.1 hypothetical protein K493DRAFT_309030 [Basidiobolus meristosporus CBS 931.73]
MVFPSRDQIYILLSLVFAAPILASEHQHILEVNIEGTPMVFTLTEKDIAYNDLIHPGKIPSIISDPRENVRLGLLGFFLITLFCIFSMLACCCIRVYLHWSRVKYDNGQLIGDEFLVRFEEATSVGIEDPVPPYAGASYFTLTDWAVEAISNSLYTRQLAPGSTQSSLMFRQPDAGYTEEPNLPYDLPPPPLYEEVVAELIVIDIE